MEKCIKPRSVKSQETKERILDAARTIVQEYGYDYLTVRNICEESGVSTGSFYHHFKNIDEVLLIYVTSGYQRYRDEHGFSEEATCKMPPIDALFAIYRVYYEFCADLGVEFISKYYSVRNKGLDMDSQVLGPTAYKSTMFFRSLPLIERAQEQGLIREDASAKQVARDISSISKGVVFDWCLRNADMDLPGTAQRIMGSYLKGLAPEN